MCLRARIRSFKPPQLHFLPFYHNLEVDKDCLVTQFCLFCIVTSLKILASYILLPLLMYSCKFQLRNSIFIILYTITCALNDQSCRCAIKQHSFIHSFSLQFSQTSFKLSDTITTCFRSFRVNLTRKSPFLLYQASYTGFVAPTLSLWLAVYFLRFGWVHLLRNSIFSTLPYTWDQPFNPYPSVWKKYGKRVVLESPLYKLLTVFNRTELNICPTRYKNFKGNIHVRYGKK